MPMFYQKQRVEISEQLAERVLNAVWMSQLGSYVALALTVISVVAVLLGTYLSCKRPAAAAHGGELLFRSEINIPNINSRV